MLLAFKKHVTVSGSRVTGNHDAARASMGGEILVGGPHLLRVAAYLLSFPQWTYIISHRRGTVCPLTPPLGQAQVCPGLCPAFQWQTTRDTTPRTWAL